MRYYAIRPIKGGEVTGVFEWPQPEAIQEDMEYQLHPVRGLAHKGNVWVEEINKAEFENAKHLMNLPVEEIKMVSAVVGGVYSYTTGVPVPQAHSTPYKEYEEYMESIMSKPPTNNPVQLVGGNDV